MKSFTINWFLPIFIIVSFTLCITGKISVWVPVLCILSGVKITTTHILR